MRAEERGRRVGHASADVEDSAVDHGTMRRNEYVAGEVEVEPSHHSLRKLLVIHFNYKKNHHQLDWLSKCTCKSIFNIINNIAFSLHSI